MKHSDVVVFDTMLRCRWYSDARYPLSVGLLASAGMKRKCKRTVMLQRVC